MGSKIKTILQRLWHIYFTGHPKHLVKWGSFLEGAKCKCGEKWHLWDMYPHY